MSKVIRRIVTAGVVVGALALAGSGAGCASQGQPQARGGRSDFERALQQKMNNGELHSQSMTLTYPDGTSKTIQPQ